MKLVKTLVLTTLSATLLLGAPQTLEESDVETTVKHGNKSSIMLKKALKSKLKQQMKKGGVDAALKFCANNAYNITQKINRQIPIGVKIKRVSKKYRNPSNAPLSDELAVIETFETMQNANIVLPKYLVQKVSPRTYKYYQPLVIKNKVCLKCHGKVSKNIDIKRAIESRYPLDKAINHKMNDLRGVIVVTVENK